MSNTDNKISNFLNQVGNLFYLNLLWLICSIPVVTIGASTCAAFFVTLKMVNGEEYDVRKMFFKAFKSNFKQGTIMWCITAPCISLCVFVWMMIFKNDPEMIAKIGALALTVFAICINLYTYPLIARYENTIKNYIRNSIIFCLLNLVRTILLVLVVGVEIYIMTFSKWSLIGALIIGAELVIYTITVFSKKIFKTVEENGGIIIPPVGDDSAEEEIDEENTDQDSSDEEDSEE